MLLTTTTVKKRWRSMTILRPPKSFCIPCIVLPMVLVIVLYFKHSSSDTGSGFWPRITRADEGQVERLAVLQDFCKGHAACKGDNCPLGNAPNAILVHEKYEVMWCDIGKVASSALIWKMATFSGKRVNMTAGLHTGSVLKEYGIRVLSSYSPEEQRDLLKKYYKFVFVRHPVLRLMSAYKDKFINGSPYSALARKSKEHLKEIRKSGHDPDRVEFKEFIWLATNSSIRTNSHWVSYGDRCQPCSVHYDFIGKLESFDQDLQKLLALKYNVPVSSSVDLDESTRIHSTNASLSVAKQYLSKLNSYQKLSVYKRFEFDMEMFGYNWGGSGII